MCLVYDPLASTPAGLSLKVRRVAPIHADVSCICCGASRQSRGLVPGHGVRDWVTMGLGSGLGSEAITRREGQAVAHVDTQGPRAATVGRAAHGLYEGEGGGMLGAHAAKLPCVLC